MVYNTLAIMILVLTGFKRTHLQEGASPCTKASLWATSILWCGNLKAGYYTTINARKQTQAHLQEGASPYTKASLCASSISWCANLKTG